MDFCKAMDCSAQDTTQGLSDLGYSAALVGEEYSKLAKMSKSCLLVKLFHHMKVPINM